MTTPFTHPSQAIQGAGEKDRQSTAGPAVRAVECGMPSSAEQSERNAAATRLLAEWMADESGYDEETWPVVEKALGESRLSFRR